MSRDGSGNYTLPLPNVITGTTIESSWANTTLADMEVEMTDSLSRSGSGGMLSALKLIDGTISAPGLSFNNEASGLYRAGANELRMAVNSTDIMRWTATGVQYYDTTWKDFSVVPDGSADDETLRWDNTGGTWAANTNFKVTAAGAVTADSVASDTLAIGGAYGSTVPSTVIAGVKDTTNHGAKFTIGVPASADVGEDDWVVDGLEVRRDGVDDKFAIGISPQNLKPVILYGKESPGEHTGNVFIKLQNAFSGATAGFKFTAWDGVSSYVDVLTVRSNGLVTIDDLGTGTVYSNSGILTNTDPSDAKLKTRIDPVNSERAMDAVIGIPACTFQWKSNEREQGTQYGFIAQDVQKYLPELVKEDNGALGIKSQQLVSVLWAAVKELALRVEELEADRV